MKTKRRRPFNEYARRRYALTKMGFRTYNDYLHSKTWIGIRKRILSSKPNCICCRVRPAVQVHHSKYDHQTMLGLDPTSLHPVCRQCHEYAEHDGKRKTSLEEANARLKINVDVHTIRKMIRELVQETKTQCECSTGTKSRTDGTART